LRSSGAPAAAARAPQPTPELHHGDLDIYWTPDDYLPGEDGCCHFIGGRRYWAASFASWDDISTLNTI